MKIDFSMKNGRLLGIDRRDKNEIEIKIWRKIGGGIASDY